MSVVMPIMICCYFDNINISVDTVCDVVKSINTRHTYKAITMKKEGEKKSSIHSHSNIPVYTPMPSPIPQLNKTHFSQRQLTDPHSNPNL